MISITCTICNSTFSVKPYRKKTAKFCSRKCRGIWKSKHHRGETHPNWKGGVTERSRKAKSWAQHIKERDNFTCQTCGTLTIEVVAHHIKSWSTHPDQRFDLENGVTLCLECHSKEHPELSIDFIKHAKTGRLQKCLVCLKQFYVNKSRIRVCCSKPCAGALRSKPYDKVCCQCNKNYKTNRERSRFCSRKCAGIYGRWIRWQRKSLSKKQLVVEKAI